MNIPLNIDFQQILLHMFNFLILAGGLYFILYAPVKKFMDDRAAHYEAVERETQGRLDEAEALRQEAEARLGTLEHDIAEKKATAMLEVECLHSAAVHDAQQERIRLIAEARLAAQQEKERILQQERQEVVEILVQAAEKMVREKESIHD